MNHLIGASIAALSILTLSACGQVGAGGAGGAGSRARATGGFDWDGVESRVLGDARYTITWGAYGMDEGQWSHAPRVKIGTGWRTECPQGPNLAIHNVVAPEPGDAGAWSQSFGPTTAATDLEYSLDELKSPGICVRAYDLQGVFTAPRLGGGRRRLTDEEAATLTETGSVTIDLATTLTRFASITLTIERVAVTLRYRGCASRLTSGGLSASRADAPHGRCLNGQYCHVTAEVVDHRATFTGACRDEAGSNSCGVGVRSNERVPAQDHLCGSCGDAYCQESGNYYEGQSALTVTCRQRASACGGGRVCQRTSLVGPRFDCVTPELTDATDADSDSDSDSDSGATACDLADDTAACPGATDADPMEAGCTAGGCERGYFCSSADGACLLNSRNDAECEDGDGLRDEGEACGGGGTCQWREQGVNHVLDCVEATDATGDGDGDGELDDTATGLADEDDTAGAGAAGDDVALPVVNTGDMICPTGDDDGPGSPRLWSSGTAGSGLLVECWRCGSDNTVRVWRGTEWVEWHSNPTDCGACNGALNNGVWEDWTQQTADGEAATRAFAACSPAGTDGRTTASARNSAREMFVAVPQATGPEPSTGPRHGSGEVAGVGCAVSSAPPAPTWLTLLLLGLLARRRR